MDWDDAVVLVTGGSRGIGLATAAHFLGAGASVVIAGRGEEALRAAEETLRAAEGRREAAEEGREAAEEGREAAAVHQGGGRVRSVTADVSTVAGCDAAVDAALGAFGRLDVLFTNAGGYESAPLGEVTEQLWDRTIDTHLKGTFFCVQAAAPALRAARGCVVTMASDAGLLGLRGGWAAYCAAMGGVVNLTRQLAADLAPDVRVNAVAPGPVGTEQLYQDLSAASYGGLEGAADGIAAMTATLALRRMTEPQDVARAVFFLAGMPAMTGAVLSIDAGTTIALP